MEDREVRRKLAQAIVETVDQHAELDIAERRSWIDEDNTGPMGGKSSQVLLAMKIDGRLVGVAFNIYCEPVIVDQILIRIEKEEREQEDLERIFPPRPEGGE